MKLLTLAGVMQCGHGGVVRLSASQSWVRIDDSPVLLEPDPRSKSIVACPIPPGAGSKPCTKTLPLQQGYSSWIFVDGKPVCRDDASGRTDGLPAGGVSYLVIRPGQGWVEEAG